MASLGKVTQGAHNAPMAANPNPTRITEAQWWFIEQLLALEPSDTVFAGAWTNKKPGYHCDRNTLLATPAWVNDYSIRLPADKRGPGQYGAAVDWTFRSAQNGDFKNISKYGSRIEAAFKARDPRLKGWREVLLQADMDAPPEGFDFQTWTTRVPDATHMWHFHFSELRENVELYENKIAMLSVLRGGTKVIRIVQQKGTSNFWTSDGVWRTAFPAADLETMKYVLRYNFMSPDSVLVVDRPDLFGRVTEAESAGSGGGGGGATPAEVQQIVHDELGQLTLKTSQS